MQGDQRDFEAVLDLLRCGEVTVLSGAGLSTESGIPAYRDRDGERRVQPMTAQELLRDVDARRRYWARAYVGWPRFASARPNAGHEVVARLQHRGVLGTVITQNVDGLHQKAGAHDVLELHGTLSRVRCMTCDERYPREWVDEWLARANPDFDRRYDGEVRPDGDVVLPQRLVDGFRLVHCVVCGSDVLKPDVVMFGEAVDKPLVQTCFERVESAPALLVLGSSLMVMSGYRFVRRAVSQGIPVAVLTQGRTRADGDLSYKLEQPLGPLLGRLEDALAHGP